MKVLQINTTCGYGSTGKIAVDLYKELEKQGHECLIAYGRKTAPEGINTYKIGTDLDMYYHGAASRVFDRHGFASKKATEQLVEKIKAFNPDVIHLHALHGYYLNIEVLFNYLATLETKIIWTQHDCWSFTGHCSHFDFIRCQKWKTACYSCPQKKEYPASNLLDNSQKNYLQKKELFTSVKNMTIISPSQWLAELIKESFLNKYPVSVINNGIDLDVFKPTVSDFRRHHQIEGKYIILGVASVWSERKGLDTFVQLAKQLDDTFQIVVVGVTKKQKETLPLNIIAIERTSNAEELASIYTVADVFVNPTLEDNYPTTNLESLACGTPVITYNTGGSYECLSTENGKVIEKNNFEQLWGSIIEKQKYKIKIEKEIDKKVLYQKYIRIYEGNQNVEI